MHKSNMYPILSKIENMSPMLMMLLWIMKERYNVDSNYKSYFDSLPEVFNIGISLTPSAMITMVKSQLWTVITDNTQEKTEIYKHLFPGLCKQHPDIFPAEFYTLEQFHWACELWYSNSFGLTFPDGKVRVCLVPIAGFFNHSIHSHILHYGEVDSVTNSLKFRLSRPCRAGEECYLNYGNFPGYHLIAAYGFLPEGDNYNDIIVIDTDNDELRVDAGVGSDCPVYMVRGTWLSKNHSIFHYGLPSPLLEHCRKICKIKRPELTTKCKLQESLEYEIDVINLLLSILNRKMEAIEHRIQLQDRSSTSWDMKLAIKYNDLEWRIISSNLDACHAARKLIENELNKCT